MSDATRLKSTVYVGGLDSAVTKDILHAAFIPFGEVVDVTIPRPDVPQAGEVHRGFGYVEYELAQDAKEAIDNMDQSELYGRVIKVAQAKPQKNLEEGLGSKTAIWEREGYMAEYGTRAPNEADTTENAPEDPMEGLDKLDVAGPKPQ